MKCETGKSYPPTNISWVVEGNPAPSMASVTKKEDDGWITTSEITITVSNLVTIVLYDTFDFVMHYMVM